MALLPHQFRAADTTYTLRIDAYTLRAVREEIGINLYAANDDNFALMRRLDADPIELAAVLYVVCRDQCKAAAVSEETFFRALAGDVLYDANRALWRAVANSFSEPGKRRATHEVLTQAEALAGKVMEAINARLDHLSTDSNYTISFGNAPASLDSTPTASRSANSKTPPSPAGATTGTKPPSSGPNSPTPSAPPTPRRPTRPTFTPSATTATTPNRKKRSTTTRNGT